MNFRICHEAKDYFANITNVGGAYSSSEEKNRFMMFDPFYCCALIGMASVEIDPDDSDSSDIIQGYPASYRESKALIAGLLISTEAKRKGIDINNPRLESIMLDYLSGEDETLLTDEGIKAINAYSRRGYVLYKELFPERPQSREEFLIGFEKVIKKYAKG